MDNSFVTDISCMSIKKLKDPSSFQHSTWLSYARQKLHWGFGPRCYGLKMLCGFLSLAFMVVVLHSMLRMLGIPNKKK